MPMKAPRLPLTREQILAYRRRVGALDERLPRGVRSLRRAAWAGLQDSMPRAAVLSLHARVAGIEADAWEHPSFVQIWGPRYSVFVVSERDRAFFTLGRSPIDDAGKRRAEAAAALLIDLLGGERMTYGAAARALRVNHNSLRYGTTTGTIALRWDGARQPTIWMLPRPDIDPHDARVELARRYLRVYGPATAGTFSKWAGVSARAGAMTFEALRASLIRVRTPIGDAVVLAEDEAALREKPRGAAPARLLPSGDAYFLLHGADRTLVLPDPERRNALWTSRVWPGAVLVDGEIVGVWRRAGHEVTVEPFARLSAPARSAVEAEAATLPLPDLARSIAVRWR
jgi:hypothetical protein